MSALDSAADAFRRHDQRPAVLDTEYRKRLGVWRLRQPIDVERVVQECRNHDAFRRDEDSWTIPLHEPDSAELTGEFLLYRSQHEDVLFYDFANDSLVRLDLAGAGRTYPAWRLRFWLEEYQPASSPSFVAEREVVDAETIATTETVDAATDVVGEEFFEGLRAFLNREREASRSDARRRFANLRPEQYHAEHAGVPTVESAGLDVDSYGQQVVALRVPSVVVDDDADVDLGEEFGIYPGMEVIVGRTDEGEGFPVEAEVLRVDGRDLELGVYWDRADAKADAEGAFGEDSDVQFRLGELLNPVPFDRESDAIDAVENHSRKHDVVTGEAAIEYEEDTSRRIRSGRLNGHQKHAVRTSLAAEDVHCVHGPPGTGKTRVLTHVIEKAVEEHDRVLATAHSNQAVDNLLVGSSSPGRPDSSSLHASALDGDLSIARVGDNSENAVVTERYVDADVYQADVVGATTSGAHRFRDEEFDVVVLDEASQATIPASLVPYSKGTKLVMAGDHRQLPPYHSGEHSDEQEMELSLFEHFLERYGDECATMLRQQYRMNERIAAFPNEEFYDGQLTHGQRNRTWDVGPYDPVTAIQVEGSESRTPSNSYYNDREAKAVGREVANLLLAGVQPSKIGVITPYSGQIGKIRGRLRDLTDVAPDVTEVKVATVDSFQGSERDAIVVSFVRSNPEGFTGFLTFPDEGARRLNVALTRAKKRLVLVGDWETLRTRAPDRDPEESCADLYGRLYDHLEGRDLVEAYDEDE